MTLSKVIPLVLTPDRPAGADPAVIAKTRGFGPGVPNL